MKEAEGVVAYDGRIGLARERSAVQWCNPPIWTRMCERAWHHPPQPNAGGQIDPMEEPRAENPLAPATYDG